MKSYELNVSNNGGTDLPGGVRIVAFFVVIESRCIGKLRPEGRLGACIIPAA